MSHHRSIYLTGVSRQIAGFDQFSKSEKKAIKADIAVLNQRCTDEQASEDMEDRAANEEMDMKIRNRKNALSNLIKRMNSHNKHNTNEVEDEVEVERTILPSILSNMFEGPSNFFND